MKQVTESAYNDNSNLRSFKIDLQKIKEKRADYMWENTPKIYLRMNASKEWKEEASTKLFEIVNERDSIDDDEKYTSFTQSNLDHWPSKRSYS